MAVLTYEALGQRDQAIQVLSGATPELVRSSIVNQTWQIFARTHALNK